ncbi:MAG: amidohydrolase family protein [Acidimicrobiia bacterium]|nr:amidohydrolase family protein [Acidimicrobiia bacterium]
MAETGTLIVKAAVVITIDDDDRRAEAIAIDKATGRILAVGTLAECQAAAPDAEIDDRGSHVVLPGFVDAHNHPFMSGITTMKPAHWIAPYVGFPTWDDVTAYFTKVQASEPKGVPLVFSGLDRMLQGAPIPTNDVLDQYFPDRPICIVDNSGHVIYFNSAVIEMNGWTDGPPADPTGASFGRTADGKSNGLAHEVPAMIAACGPILSKVMTHPLHQAAEWLALMSRNGVTMTSDHTFDPSYLKGYDALTSFPDAPIRIALYQMSTTADAAEKITTSNPDMLWKQGIKLWADGSPWVGSAAISFPYVDSETVRTAQIPIGPLGEKNMNYTRAELDAAADTYAPTGWQFAFHCNGDVGLDIVLDCYERALRKYDLLGTDHRWRVEHCGAARGDQFERAHSLGVTISLGVFQFIYWGDLLDGELFESAIGSQWVRVADAWKADVGVSFHNDGSVSPPVPMRNLQAAVTRTTASGKVHGANQAVTLDQALRAHTINGARQLGRDADVGSIEVGKLADLVELSHDPFSVDPHDLEKKCKVEGTWIAGRKVDLKAFSAEVEKADPTHFHHLATVNHHPCC